MKSAARLQILNLNRALSKDSWTNYRKLLGRLVKGSIDFPEKNRLLDALRANDIDLLLEIADSLSSQKYEVASLHLLANQISLFIKKYPFPKGMGSHDPELRAKEKFWKAEAKCRQLNLNMLDDFYLSGHHDLLAKARNFISYVLGFEVPLSDVLDNCDFGPGANVGVSGNATNIARKIGSCWSVTPSALHYAYSASCRHWPLLKILGDASEYTSYTCLDPAAMLSSFKRKSTIVNYNKIAFVPKTTKVHRTIAVEPLWNSFLQKGLDIVMRRRLKRIGIDLSDQSINQRMALLGSFDDKDPFVTIDLSSASDSISIEVVRNLLPPEWFSFMDAIRSPTFLMDGVQYPYHKFCSMGNGFCFPLETLIFVSICHANGCGIAGRDYHVYGDDIIVRKSKAVSVLDSLALIGFEVNAEKTFLEGPFRESCGADWFAGKDVRPFTFDFALDSLENVFKFLNLSRRSESVSMILAPCREYLYKRYPELRDWVRPAKGLPNTAIDPEECDSHLHNSSLRWNFHLQCWSWRELHSKPRTDKDARRSKYGHLSYVLAVLRGSDSRSPFVCRRTPGTTVRMVSYG